MGVNSQAYIFKKMDLNDINLVLSEIPGLNVSKKIDNTYNSVNSINGTKYGELHVEYQNNNFWIHVFIRPKTEEYVRLFPSYDNGFDESIKFIPNYGKEQYVVVLSTPYIEPATHLLKALLSRVGGVLVPNDCSDTMMYVKGSNFSKTIYNDLRSVPNIVLFNFVKDYTQNSNITKINSRLKVPVKGMDLMKEYAYRTLRNFL